MSDFYVKALFGLLRLGLMAFGGAALIGDEELEKVAGAIVVVGIGAYSVYRKYQEHQKETVKRQIVAVRKPAVKYGKRVL